MGIGSLIKSVKDSFEGAFNSLFAKTGGARSPLDPSITNVPEFADGSWKTSKGYAFQVGRVFPGSSDLHEIDGEGFQEFRLQINPQELQQEEIFAIQVTPTFRGVIVEHQGVTLKDITMSGVTGISPLRAEGGAHNSDGSPILATGHSGYQEFHELRSYFRAYVEAKRKDSRSEHGGELRMIFKNYKDNEYIFVEPQKFVMKRSASRAMLYEYQINMKGIGVASGDIPNEGFGGLVGDIISQVDSALSKIEYATDIINGSIGIIRKTERDISNTLLNPLRELNLALLAIKGGKSALLGEYGITRRFVSQLHTEATRIEANLNEVFGINISMYTQATGRTSTIVGDTSRTPTYTEYKILNALGKIKTAVMTVLQNKSYFVQDVNADFSDIEKSYVDLALVRPNSIRTTSILDNDTIQAIAARELGDPDKYREIVVLNGLRAPYISATASEGVLKFGDKIFIPSQGSAALTGGVVPNVDYNITKFLSQSEKNLGVDLRVSDEFDIVFANFGDFDLVAGIPNISQAVAIRFGLEKGSLKRHRTIGVGLEIGAKTINAFTVRSRILDTLSQDARFASIPFASVRQEGSTNEITLVVNLVQLNEPIPLKIAV